MDTKKKSDAEYLRRAGMAAIKAIEDQKPDVVIAIDDYAQKLAAMKFVNHPKVNIVFAGVNGSVKPYNYEGAENVTGIFERKPVSAIKEAVQLLSREIGISKARITLLTDATLSAQKDGRYLTAFDWAPMSYFTSVPAKDFKTWKDRVLNLKDKADFLLVGAYRKVKRQADSPTKKGYVPPEELMAWTEEHSPIPVIGINVFNTEEGAMLSVGVSPYEQGSEAALMARQIIEKKVRPGTIPVKTSQQYVVSFRKSALQRRKVKMPKIFEAFARATDNYFD
jgi:ABC-type uncharacterized transport system substrate-binding protein